MWITEIRLKNYRAFAEEVVFTIPEGKHLLVYGENGSGKSSLFRGVKEFLKNLSIKDKIKYVPHIWEDAKARIDTGYVRILTDDKTTHFWNQGDGGSYNWEPAMVATSKYSGFLSYEDLLPIYAPSQLDKIEEARRLFDLIVKVLLAHYQVPDTRFLGGTSEFLDLYYDIQERMILQEERSTEDLLEALEEYKRDEDIDAEYESEEELLKEVSKDAEETSTDDVFTSIDFTGELMQLQIAIKEAKDKIVETANEYLKTYFKSKVTFGLSDLNLRVIKKDSDDVIEYVDAFAAFGIGLHGTRIPNYKDTLNEARLSSFALCFMLAAIKILPASEGESRVLFLDDIFTGLDMNNRLPLLRLIKEEFMEAEVAPFQVGIATHDRRWYELAKSWFEQRDIDIKAVEMYAGRSEDPKQPDEVVIIQEGLSYIKKARAYFKAKDYPSTANLLRKASEEHMRKLLPRHERLRIDHNTGLQTPNTSLEDLEKKLIVYLTDNGFDLSELAPFGTFKKVVMNPLSHDDLEAPHYRAELEDAFVVVDYLLSIEVREVDFPASKKIGDFSFDFSYRDATVEDRQIIHSIIPREGLRFISVPEQGLKLLNCACRYRYDGQKAVDCESINEAIDLLWVKGGYDFPVDYGEAYGRLMVSTRRSLADILRDAQT